MTAVATTQGSSLALHQEQSFWTDNQLAALQQLGVQANSQADLAVFFHQAQATGLDPFKREIYMITRKGKPTIQTGIDGFYKIANRVSERTKGTWGISETFWCGEDGSWRDVWLPRTPPAAAKVIVERNGSRFTTVALTSEYRAQGPMWEKMPARMIAKCAEALAIRKAFPEDLSGLYTSDEMAQADNTQRLPEPVQEPPKPSVDWGAELQKCESRPDVRALWERIRDAGEMTPKLRGDLESAAAGLPDVVADTGEVVEGTLIEEES